MKLEKKAIGTVVVVALMMMFQGFVFAQETVSENEIVETLTHGQVFAVENSEHDPFKPLVQKKVKELVKPVETQETKTAKVEEKKIVVPVKIKVAGICGNNSERLAVIEFEGGEYVVKVGQMINGKFSVVEILDDRIVIFAVAQSRRDVFKLS
jgi:Tfp pilus assembly protein PilP